MAEKTRVLVVDDEEPIRRFQKHLLESDPRFTAETAASGAEALAVLERGEFPIVISDQNMPEMGGIELLSEIAHRYPGSIRILVTGQVDLAKIIKGVNEGKIFAFIMKPIREEELFMQLARALEQLAMGRHNRELALELEGKNQQLAEINRQLERKVEERTIEITEANIQIRNSQARIIQQEKLASIGQLAAGVAHELNNPIGFISSNFSTLKNYVQIFREYLGMLEPLAGLESTESGSHPQAAKISAIRKFRLAKRLDFILADTDDLFRESREGLDRVASIVQNLRDFARVDLENRIGEYDLNQGIENTLVVARNEIKYSADVRLELGEIPPIECVGGEINQVLLNILVNAAQAIRSSERREKGMIVVRTYAEGSHVYCEISDDGPGIPPGIIGRIFDPFFTTKEAGKGTGLGLNISYDIVINKHGGELTVKSEVGKGAVFTIKLPVESPRKRTEADHG